MKKTRNKEITRKERQREKERKKEIARKERQREKERKKGKEGRKEGRKKERKKENRKSDGSVTILSRSYCSGRFFFFCSYFSLLRHKTVLQPPLTN